VLFLRALAFKVKRAKQTARYLLYSAAQAPLNIMLSVTVTFEDYLSQTLNVIEKHVWFLH